ncbi:transposase-like protein [Caballeronia udeis]|uniref:Transposase-like protein n=1 Tax=Caballeronia udeis TaxID=1232866 RepID=A0ABW8MGD7_9BURK
MYSYEDRIRAVKLYIRLGKRLSMTVHQLGYPTTNRTFLKSLDINTSNVEAR